MKSLQLPHSQFKCFAHTSHNTGGIDDDDINKSCALTNQHILSRSRRCVIRVTNNIIIVMPYGGGLSPKNNNEVKCRFPLDTWSARPWTGIEWGWQSDEKCPPVHWLVVILNDLQAMMREVDAWSGSLVYSFAASSSSSSSSISATHLLTLQHFCLALIGLRRVSNGHN